MENPGNMLAQFGNRPSILSQANAMRDQRMNTQFNRLKMGAMQDEMQRNSQMRALGPGLVSGDPNALAQAAAIDPALAMEYKTKLSTLAKDERDLLGEQFAGVVGEAIKVQDDPVAFEQVTGVPHAQKDEFWRRAMTFEKVRKELAAIEEAKQPKNIHWDDQGRALVPTSEGVKVLPGERAYVDPRRTDSGGGVQSYSVPVYGPNGEILSFNTRAAPGQQLSTPMLNGQPVIAGRYNPALLGNVAGAQESSKQFEQSRGEWQRNESKLFSNISSIDSRTKVVESTIAKARPLLSKWTTSLGGLISSLPESDAKILKGYLDTLRANIGFAELQSMRESSPTGGALGQVSEMENQLLQSVLGPLDQTNDLKVLGETFDSILQQRRELSARVREAYNMDRKKYSGQFTVSPPQQTGEPIVQPTDKTGVDMSQARRSEVDGKLYVPDPNRPGKYLEVVE